MTTDSDKCSFSSILPMSCRGRAEAFARRLHSRLRSLGSQDGSPTNESSWLATNENPIAISQPRHSSDSDLCFDFTLLDSPGSPEEEIPEAELVNFVAYNKDNLHVVPSEDCYHTKPKITAISLNSNCRPISPDSDSSEGQYFDPDSDIDSKATPRLVNGLGEDCNGFNHYSEESALSLTVSEEDSTLDLWDCPVEFSSLTHDDSVPETTKDVPSKISESEDENKINDADINLVSRNSSSIEQPIEIDSNSEVNQRSSESLRLNLSSEIDSNKDNILNGYSDVGDSTDDEITPQGVQLINGIESINETTQTDSELLNKEEESYCSSLRIENNLTVDIDNAKESENALVNKVEVDIQPTNDEIEDQEEPTPRVRRCSSLKTGKTPPGTPGRKKIVRFADVLGLDLADVRTFLDEIPKIPNSAYSDLLNADLSCSLSDSSLSSTDSKLFKNAGNKPGKMLVPLFQQPGGQINFLDRVRENQVCLENAIIDDPTDLSVKGMVRVRNLDFHKSVHIRYSIDSWKSYSDLQAAYVQNSCDGFSDKFSFLLYANAVSVGQRLEFAVRFQCKGCQYWDSNNGANYAFQCLPSTSQTPYTPITGADEHWGATFY